MSETIEFVEERTWKTELRLAVTVYTWEEFKEYNIKDKMLYGAILPVILWMRLSVPILDENDMNKSWNKMLSILQV